MFKNHTYFLGKQSLNYENQKKLQSTELSCVDVIFRKTLCVIHHRHHYQPLRRRLNEWLRDAISRPKVEWTNTQRYYLPFDVDNNKKCTRGLQAGYLWLEKMLFIFSDFLDWNHIIGQSYLDYLDHESSGFRHSKNKHLLKPFKSFSSSWWHAVDLKIRQK